MGVLVGLQKSKFLCGKTLHPEPSYPGNTLFNFLENSTYCTLSLTSNIVK
jgi:hypothetical protein